MKNNLFLFFAVLVNLTLKAQNIQSSAPDSVYNFDYSISWWDSEFGSDFVPDLDTIDNQSIFTEICSNVGSDTLFLGSFSFNTVDLENSTIYLQITKSKSGSDIRDAYLVAAYNGEIISENLADTVSIWSENDSTSTYILDNSVLNSTLDNNILNDKSFGFLFSTSPSDPFCMNAFINSVRLYIEENDITNVTSSIDQNDLIKLFPNPTDGELNIDLNDMENYHVKILNSSGQKIKEYFNISNSLLRIDLADQAAGIYFAVITNEENSIYHKFLIK